jgi:hypothetical protein
MSRREATIESHRRADEEDQLLLLFMVVQLVVANVCMWILVLRTG